MYLDDLEQLSTVDLPFDLIRGKLRNRDLGWLTSCSESIGQEQHGLAVFRALLQIEAFFKKNGTLVQEDACFQKAYEGFLESEEVCADTCTRLYLECVERLETDDLFLSQVCEMKRFISSVLGPYGGADGFLNRIPELLRLTEGASAYSGRKSSHRHMKVKMRNLAMNPEGWHYLNAFCALTGHSTPRVVNLLSNRVEVVPKNWKTHRTIACEPEGNIPFQLAFDAWVKERLIPHGIDLRNQSRNQQLAKEGSVANNYATIDLKAASDRVARILVDILFPEEFASYLYAFRSPGYFGKFGTGEYCKFSSMGNGSTFVIETLIFAAACRAVGSKDYCVYGDDIVISETGTMASDLISLLERLGFEVNQEKTHLGTTPYRESCGCHWYLGSDVTPFYLRDGAETLPGLSHIVNGLAAVIGMPGKLWDYLHSLVVAERLPLVPYGAPSTSGVVIDVPTAYRTNALRSSKRQILSYRGFLAKARKYAVTDSRSLFLWHLSKLSGNMLVLDRTDADVRGSVPQWEERASVQTVTSPTQRYVRKSIHWLASTKATPLHLYWWSDYLTQEIR